MTHSTPGLPDPTLTEPSHSSESEYDYHILESIGGSNSSVFLAFSERDGKDYALKVFPWKNDQPDPRYSQRVKILISFTPKHYFHYQNPRS